MTLGPVTFASMIAIGLAGAAAQRGGPPGDREIRVAREGSVHVTTLTLMLRGDGGPLPINLTLTGRGDPSRPTVPPTYALEFQFPLYVGPRSYDSPHYRLSAATSAGESVIAQGDIDGRFAFDEVSVIQGRFDLVDLSRMVSASSVSGHVLGVPFALTADQIAALGEFAKLVLKG